MSGGQSITVSAGTLGTVGGRTLALVGSAIALSAGVITGGSHGQVLTISQGSVTAVQSGGVPLSSTHSFVQYAGEDLQIGGATLTFGALASMTAGDGTLTPLSQPPAMTGLPISVSAGTMVPEGSAQTVHLSGQEADFALGTIVVGGQLLAGMASTPAQGAYGLDLTVPVSGEGMVSESGTISPEQGADDTLITSFEGLMAGDFTLALSGAETTSAPGSVSTGDAFALLTGSSSTAEAGSFAFEESYPIVGSLILADHGTFGAPGFASLSGAEITAAAGSVFLDNDRTYPLVGESVSVLDGAAVTSYLAFVTGQELASGLEGIGPRTLELVGLEIDAQDGRVVGPPEQEHGHSGGWHGHHPHHHPRHKTKDDVRLERIALGIIKEQAKPKKKVPLAEMIAEAALEAEVSVLELEEEIERLKREIALKAQEAERVKQEAKEAKRKKEEEMLLLGD